MFSKIKILSSLLIMSVISITANATIVEFITSHGNFKVNLHDSTTPITVDNFLTYVNNGAYDNTVVHRSEPNFVVQAGGFYFDGELPLKAITTNPPIKNEPVYSNVRGTIAMAKQAGNPDSATSQWFINLKDNSSSAAQLDLQNSGFTVFGEIIDDGMNVVDQIAQLPRCSAVPVNDNSGDNCTAPGAENFVTIYQVSVIDDGENTDSNLNSVKNTLIQQQDNDADDNDSSGGSFYWLSLILISSLIRQRN